MVSSTDQIIRELRLQLLSFQQLLVCSPKVSNEVRQICSSLQEAIHKLHASSEEKS